MYILLSLSESTCERPLIKKFPRDWMRQCVILHSVVQATNQNQVVLRVRHHDLIAMHRHLHTSSISSEHESESSLGPPIMAVNMNEVYKCTVYICVLCTLLFPYT